MFSLLIGTNLNVTNSEREQGRKLYRWKMTPRYEGIMTTCLLFPLGMREVDGDKAEARVLSLLQLESCSESKQTNAIMIVERRHSY